jgi:ParB/RepB/Spo0J family partition protein
MQSVGQVLESLAKGGLMSAAAVTPTPSTVPEPRGPTPEPRSAAATSPKPPAAPQLIPVDAISPSPTNPRKSFDAAALKELAASVRVHGVLQPVLVRPAPKGGKLKTPFELVAGERRWRAAKEAGLAEIPALVRELTDVEVIDLQLVENLQRTDLHPIEEAEGYRQLTARGYDVARIAERVGRSVKYVYDRVKLLSLTKEAQKFFLDGKFSAGHAILLARLKPEDQKRALDPASGGVFDFARTLRNPYGKQGRGTEYDLGGDSLKPASVRETQAWIAEHVRFDHTVVPDPMLFPDTASEIRRAQEKAEKIVPITFEYQLGPDERVDGQRVYTERSWKRADGKFGSKPCPRAVLGVVVVGPGHGEAFRVCINREHCTIHWSKEQREKKAREASAAKGDKTREERWKIEEQKRQEEQRREEARKARWRKALPAILEAVAAAVKKAPTKATGLLAEIVVRAVASTAGYSNAFPPAKAATYVPRGSTAEDVLRHAAFIALGIEAGHPWQAPREFAKRARAFGIDVQKILDAAAPEEPAPEKESKATARPGKAKASRRSS